MTTIATVQRRATALDFSWEYNYERRRWTFWRRTFAPSYVAIGHVRALAFLDGFRFCKDLGMNGGAK